MTLEQASLLIIIVPPILFLVIAILIRPPWKIIGFALLAGLVVGGVNMLGDYVAHMLELWKYPFTETVIAPPYMYLNSAIFYGAGIIGLLGWWIRRKWNWKGAIIFLIAFPFLALARDVGGSALTDTSGSLIVWGSGATPYLADFLLWLIMECSGFFLLFGLEKISK